MSLLRTLLAFVSGAIAALIWLERQTSSPRRQPTPPAPSVPPVPPVPQSPAPQASPAEPQPEPERIVEQVVVPDPEQSARIEALEAELAEQRAMRTSRPDDSQPGVDAIRAARARAFELERQLSQQRADQSPSWFEIEPPAATVLIDQAAEYLPRVAIRVELDSTDAGARWRVLGAMQEFAEASEGAWFEFDGDFARWCVASGHYAALDPDQVGFDAERPTFPVEVGVNRSGQLVVPTYALIGETRLYYVDDVAGETGRMHVVGLA